MTTFSVCRTLHTVTCLCYLCMVMRQRYFRLGRMWLLVWETNGESYLRQWSWLWCCQMCQCMELGHLCVRQCVSNYVRSSWCSRKLSTRIFGTAVRSILRITSTAYRLFCTLVCSAQEIESASITYLKLVSLTTSELFQSKLAAM